MTALATDSLLLARRNLAHIRQIPEKLIDVTLQPVMFVLLFAYVFGGAIAATLAFADGRPETDDTERRLIVPLREHVRLVDVVRALDAEGVEAVDVQRREATLDDVFLTVTGARPTESASEELAA